MSAHEQMRNMLDQLMGTTRDGHGEDDSFDYTDYRVCRSFLLGCCPHEVLAATRMDMGECPRYHQLALRADYEKAQQSKDHFYDLDALEHLERFFDECDRKTELAKKRLAETQEELSQEAAEKAEKVLEMNEKIGKTLAEAEKLGIEGNVEESLKLMEEVEALKTAKQEFEMDYRNSMPASSYQQQKLRVCEICSAYLGIHDNDRRLADHFGGKLHMGFVFLREKLEELRSKASQRLSEREAQRSNRYSNDYGSSSSSRRGGRYQQDDDSYDRRRTKTDSSGKSKEGGHSRSRSRDYERDRSRRSRDHRSRSRDKERRKSRKRSRDRSRSRKKSRDRRSRSRDGDRERDRERNRDRDRERSSSKNKKKKHDRCQYRSRSRSNDRRSKKERSNSTEHMRKEKGDEDGRTHSGSPGETSGDFNRRDSNNLTPSPEETSYRRYSGTSEGDE